MRLGIVLMVFLLAVCGAAQTSSLITVHVDQPIGAIDSRIFGGFNEATLSSYQGGVLSEMLYNRKFEIPEEGRGPGNFNTIGVAAGWEPVQFASSVSFLVDRNVYYSPTESQRITKTDGGEVPAGIQQSGYQYVPPQLGMQQKLEDPFDFKPGVTYRIRLAIKSQNLHGNVTVALGESWENPTVKHNFVFNGEKGWVIYRCDLTPRREIPNGKFMIYIDKPGTIWVDSVSMVRKDLDENGFRKDVLELTREVKPTSIRWPGGWFVSDYDWRDGIGPVDKRPASLNRPWLGYWNNDIGIDEFVELCRKLHAQPYVSVNVGTGTPEEAAALVEYANDSIQTKWGGLRARNGHPEPYHIRDWSIGNEEYLETIGGTPGSLYGERSIAFAKAMRAVDPDIHLVAVGVFDLQPGPSASQKPYFQFIRFMFNWNRQVLPLAGQVMNYYSIHHYDPGESVSGMSASEIDQAATLSADDLSAKLDRLHSQMDRYSPAGKRFPIALDEWAVSLPHAKPAAPEQKKKEALLGLHGPMSSLRDALAEAAVYNLMQQRPKDFAMAHHTFLYVYGGGEVGIGRDRAVVSSSGRVLEMYSTYDQCQSLKTEVKGPTFDFPRRNGIAGDYEGVTNAPYLDVSARLHPDGVTLEIFVLNRNLNEDMDADLRISGGPVKGSATIAVLDGNSLTDWNSFDEPNRVAVKHVQIHLQGDQLGYRFPAHSLSVLTLKISPS